VVTTPSSNLGQISSKGQEIFDTRHFMKLDTTSLNLQRNDNSTFLDIFETSNHLVPVISKTSRKKTHSFHENPIKN
jgi:hypothetical protein